MNIIKASQFQDKKFLEELFSLTENIEKNHKFGDKLKGKVLASLFYEPSTRTRLSFESAMTKLGGSVIGTENASVFSSVSKGESLTDTIKTVCSYSDIIVLRHPEDNSAEEASKVSTVPLINAGSGIKEHPTQALLDLYTIKKELGRLNNFTIIALGDLLYGRTIHSLALLLTLFDNVKIIFVSPEKLRVPEDVKVFLKEKNLEFSETESLKDVVNEADVLYVTRIQKERFKDKGEYEKLKGYYVIDRSTLKFMKDNAVIMHPLPRVDEINKEIDNDKRSAYFRQVKNGLYIRMALLLKLLS